MQEKREYEMSTIKKHYFEGLEGGEVIRVRNRIQANKGEQIKFQTQISKDRRKANWIRQGKSNV